MEENEEVKDVKFVMKKRSRRRPIVKLLILLGVLAVVLAFCGWRFYRNVSAPIDIENASTAKAVGWLAFRDLTRESAETRAELFDMYFGKITDDPDAAFSFDPDKDAIEIPSNLQSVVHTFLKSGEEKVDEWNRKRVRPPFVRIDYVIRGDGESTSQYVVSSDVFPGPALQERWQQRHIAATTGESHTTNVERNVQMLLMQWFESRLKSYDAAPDAEKKAFLERCADEVDSLQKLYASLRASAGMRKLNRSEQLREFERQNEGWCEFAELEELARVIWFKDLVVSVVVMRELNQPNSDLYPPKAPRYSTVSVVAEPAADAESADSAGAASADAEPAVDAGAARPVLDAIRNYFFEK